MVQHPLCYPRMDPGNLKRSEGIPSELAAFQSSTEYDLVDKTRNYVFQPSRDKHGENIHRTRPGAPQTSADTNLYTMFPWYRDLNLAAANIEFWTIIPVDSAFVVEVIAKYLVTDHPVLGFFDPAIFLPSLTRKDVSLCSAFEVNSLLAFASVSSLYYARKAIADDV